MLPQHRLGMVAPLMATDELPYDFYRLLQSMGDWGVSLTEAAINLGAFSSEAVDEANQRLEMAVESLVLKGADLLVLGGIPVVALKGLSFWRERLRGLSQSVGRPFFCDLDSVLVALHTLGARRIAIADKWDLELNQQLVRDVEEFGDGIKVVHVVNHPHTAAAVSSLSSEAGVAICRDLCREAMQTTPERPDVLLLAGGAWHSLLVVQELEDELGVPIITNPGTAFWYGLYKLGHLHSVSGWGKLFTTAPSKEIAG